MADYCFHQTMDRRVIGQLASTSATLPDDETMTNTGGTGLTDGKATAYGSKDCQSMKPTDPPTHPPTPLPVTRLRI